MWRPTYMVFTANAALPIAITALGLLVLVGWTREISLATSGMFVSAAYFDGWLNRPPSRRSQLALGRHRPVVVLSSAGVMALVALSSAKSRHLPGGADLRPTGGHREDRIHLGYLSGGLGGGDETATSSSTDVRSSSA